MALKPKFARVLLRREKVKESTGGIILPESAQIDMTKSEGRVVAVGPDCDESIAVDMFVIFGKFAGTWIEDGDDA